MITYPNGSNASESLTKSKASKLSECGQSHLCRCLGPANLYQLIPEAHKGI
jgi:hypothetical protein